jgi:hypothetical protein
MQIFEVEQTSKPEFTVFKYEGELPNLTKEKVAAYKSRASAQKRCDELTRSEWDNPFPWHKKPE